jgi:hypothetical protein
MLSDTVFDSICDILDNISTNIRNDYTYSKKYKKMLSTMLRNMSKVLFELDKFPNETHKYNSNWIDENLEKAFNGQYYL